MADIQINSLQNSSLARAMTSSKNVDLREWDYKSSKACVPFSKNKYEVNLPECDFNSSNVRLKIPKLGMVQNMTLKVAIKIQGNTGSKTVNGNITPIGFGGGLNLIKRVKLTNGKDTILELSNESLNLLISSYDFKKSMALKLGANYQGLELKLYDETGKESTQHASRWIDIKQQYQDAGTTIPKKVGYAEVYIPLLFSPFLEDLPSEYLDFSFFQQLYIEIDFNNWDKLVVGSISDNQPYIFHQQSKLIVNYLNFNNEDYTAIQKSRYTKNLNYIWSDYWYFDTVKTTINRTKLQKVVVDIPCDKLMKKIYIKVHSDAVGSLDAIHNITLNAVGREIMSFSGSELLLLRNYQNNGVNNAPFLSKLSKNDVLNTDSYRETHKYLDVNENYALPTLESIYYVIDLTLPTCSRGDRKPIWSGGVRFTNNMNANLEIQLSDPVYQSGDHVVSVITFAEFYNVVRVNSSSGELEVSENR